MSFKDLNKKKETELQKILAEERQKLYELRLKVSVNQLKEVRQVRVVRKRIAQILTRLAQLSKTQATPEATE